MGEYRQNGNLFEACRKQTFEAEFNEALKRINMKPLGGEGSLEKGGEESVSSSSAYTPLTADSVLKQFSEMIQAEDFQMKASRKEMTQGM
jgi:hypothetical protein